MIIWWLTMVNRPSTKILVSRSPQNIGETPVRPARVMPCRAREIEATPGVSEAEIHLVGGVRPPPSRTWALRDELLGTGSCRQLRKWLQWLQPEWEAATRSMEAWLEMLVLKDKQLKFSHWLNIRTQKNSWEVVKCYMKYNNIYIYIIQYTIYIYIYIITIHNIK